MQDGIDRGRVGRIYWLVGGLAVLAFSGGVAAALPWLFSIVAVGATAGAFYQAKVLRGRAEKVSSEIDALSARLLRMEARLVEPDRQSTGLTSTVAEVTGEIALLGGIVRDLTVT